MADDNRKGGGVHIASMSSEITVNFIEKQGDIIMLRKGKKLLSSILCVVFVLTSVIPSTLAVYADDTVTGSVITNIVDDASREIDFNEGWQFYLATRTPSVAGGSGASGFATYGLADAGDYTTSQIISTGFDDSSWRTLTVPHDFSVEGAKVSSGSNSQGYLQGGLGWYRKTFTLPESFDDDSAPKCVMIDFEGVYQNCIVYLNGIEVGNYPNGYTGFSYDLTEVKNQLDEPVLNYGENNPNVIVVKVQNMSPSGRWYTGSGIVRPVSLIVTEQVRINRNGVTLSSPDLKTSFDANGSAQLQVNASITSGISNGAVSMTTTVYDASDNQVAQATTDESDINAGASTISQNITVSNVNLWYPWNAEGGDPYLYTVITELRCQKSGNRMY